MRNARYWGSAVCLLGLMSAGCGSKDAVSLAVGVGEVDLRVQAGTLGSRLEGGFTAELRLGPEASSSTSVSIEDFSLTSTEGSELVARFAPSTTTQFPLSVAPGSNVRVRFEQTEELFLSAEELTAVCAGNVVVSASFRDSLGGGEVTPGRSGPEMLDGC